MSAVQAEANPDYANASKPQVAKFRRPMPPVFTDIKEEQRYRKGRLAIAARIFHDEGWGSGCAVQMSVRDNVRSDHIWILPAGRPLALMLSSDLIEVRLSDGAIVSGDSADRGYDLNAFAIHAAIYRGRADLGAIIHGHTPYGQAFSQQGRTISMMVQDSCTFHKKLPVLPFGVGLEAAAEPEQVSALLGDGKGFIMQNRGILLAGASIECAVSYFIRLENLCHAELLCQAAIKGRGGSIVLVGEEEVKFTFDNTGSEHHAWLMARPYYQKQNLVTGGALVI